VCGADDAALDRRIEAIGRTRDTLGGALWGTPAKLVDEIDVYREAGADTVYLQMLDLHDLDHLRLLGSEVVAHFR
jgi:alkanesulfonate monooxygenase SsuD/methylene tetrahydromethanopterin reductase-like flavin-dependent oxidoreductase (luciferase family)